ncbi:ABC transporter permease [Clostridium hydrogeniformans]|uniref:ABC transporter permease n=1 Tax=Clostridium hydrogeniformans TaxID=349933 RepID=UPI000AAEA9A6|nr:ABC-2 family transporter protein [Clostridium hydrogeniformans]
MKLINGIKLYFTYVKTSIRSQMEYKTSFILLSLSTFFVGFTEFLGVIILFDRFGNIKGWTLYEIALFYGMINMTFSIAEAMARGFDLFSRQVISGDFDRILLRPRSTALQILGVEFTVMRIGRISLGLFLILYSSCKLNVVFDFYNISLLLFSVIGSVCLFIGLFIIQGTMCFWSTESLEIMNMLTYGGVETMQYPLSIYGKWFKRFFIFVVPLGCVNYFPLILYMNKDDYINYPRILYYLSPCLGIIFLLVSLKLWNIGVTHYRSTGS